MKAIQSRGRAIALALLLILLPVAALAATAALTDGLVNWHAVGGSSATASTGGAYAMMGAAGQVGGGTVASGGGYSLSSGYVPIPAEAQITPEPPGNIFSWLPFVTKGAD